ncbi:hypothetical protein CMI47_17820 [Candidatus Pacearchaeota archaeon]|nr:hypothetical protein [Candidatus Pacearchaeota archaeon]
MRSSPGWLAPERISRHFVGLAKAGGGMGGQRAQAHGFGGDVGAEESQRAQQSVMTRATWKEWRGDRSGCAPQEPGVAPELRLLFGFGAGVDAQVRRSGRNERCAGHDDEGKPEIGSGKPCVHQNSLATSPVKTRQQ